MPGSTGGPSPRRSVTRKLAPPRAAWMGNSQGMQQATGGDGKPAAGQNWPWAMPTATRSPWPFAQSAMDSPDLGKRKGSEEKSMSRRPRATRWPDSSRGETRDLEVVVEDPPASRNGIVAPGEAGPVVAVAHAPDEGRADLDALGRQELEQASRAAC